MNSNNYLDTKIINMYYAQMKYNKQYQIYKYKKTLSHPSVTPRGGHHWSNSTWSGDGGS